MHYKNIFPVEPWENVFGDDSEKNHSKVTLNQPTTSLQPDSDTRKSRSKANRQQSAAVKGRILESIALQPGARREAHLHSNTAQMDYVVSGCGRIGIMGQKNEVEIHSISAGDVTYIPMGYGHWVENMSETSPLLVLVLANEDS